MARPKNCGRCIKPKTKCKCGRPTVMTKEVLRKLESAFSIQCTDEEACAYAGIGETTLYDYQKENPEFVKRKAQLRLKANIKTRKTIYTGLDTLGGAQWFAERSPSLKKEFTPKQDVEVSGTVKLNFSEEAEKRRKKYE